MKKLLALLCLLALAACYGDRPMSKQGFTEDFAAHLRQAAPTLKVEIKTELELKVTNPAGGDSIAYLDNSYREYCANPKDKEAVFAQFVGGLVEASNAVTKETPLDPAMITPVIKDLAWIAEITASTRVNQTKNKPIEFVSEPLNRELVIVYARDSEKNLSYLTPAEIQQAGLKTEDLRKLAVQNLQRMLKVEAKGGKGIYMMTAGGTYEASLLLFDSIWEEKRMKVEGDYVVAVPSRDLLLITGTGETEGLKKIRDLARSAAAEGSYRLTPDLFVYRDGKFVKFEN